MQNINSNTNKTWVKDQPSPYQLHDITHFPDWGNLVVWDAFFNNLTSGLMVITILVWAAGAPIFAGVLPFALTIALAILVIDLGLLITDLGDPVRFFHSLRVMRFTSALSVGVWGLSCYGIFLGLATILSWWLYLMAGSSSILFTFITALMRLFTIMALVGAIVVICYKGVVFSCSSQPGVKDARWLTPFLVSDSLLMGLGLYGLITLAIVPNAVVSLIVPMITLIVVRSITFGLLWQDVKARARVVYTWENSLVTTMSIGIGGILAIILLFCGWFCFALAAVFVLCAGMFERLWFIGLTKPI